jgi:hypothetical protein
MAFHRLTTPAYIGGLPGTHDYINDPVANGDPGAAAPADGKKASGVNQGTYMVAFGEDATASDTNRPAKALAQNTDFLDDVVSGQAPVTFHSDGSTVGALATVVLTGEVFVGKSGFANNQENRDRLISVLNSTTLDELVDGSGVRVKVSSITDGVSNIVGTEADGFYTNPTLNFTPSIPASTSYRIVYGKRSSLVNAIKNKDDFDALTYPGIRVAHRNTAEFMGHTTNLTLKHPDTAITTLGKTGAATDLSAGTVASQLQELIDELPGLGRTNVWTAANNFDLAVTFDAANIHLGQDEFRAGIKFTTDLTSSVECATGVSLNFLMINGDLTVGLETTGKKFEVSNGGGVVYFRADNSGVFVGDDTGVADAYAADAVTFKGTTLASGNEAHALIFGPAASITDGAPLIIAVGQGNAAGETPGHVMFDVHAVEDGKERRWTYVPTESHRLADNNALTKLTTHAGGVLSRGRALPNSSVCLIEAWVFAVGDNPAGTPTDNFGAWKRTAVGRRNAAGTYALIGAVQSNKSEHNFAEDARAIVVDIVADANGFHIEITAPSTAGTPIGQLWWGFMRVSALAHTDVPDN